MTKDARLLCQLIVGVYAAPLYPFDVKSNAREQKMKGITHRYCLVIDRLTPFIPSRIPMSTTMARPPHLDSLRGRGDWVGGCDAEYTSVWKIWPSTATEMPSDASGKLCTESLKETSAYTRQRW